MHDPGKVLLDLAVAVALGGDCLADVAVVRAQPDLFADVASESTVSRLVAALATAAPAALAAVRQARAQARERVWQLSPPVGTDGPIGVDLDATIVLAHSEKEGATPTWKRTFGCHPLLAFLDHGPGGTGEQLAGLLRVGKATANDAADHISVLTDALAQLPAEQRSRVPVRGDSGAGVHAFVHHLHELGLHYSVGLYAHQPIIDALGVLPRQAWRPAVDGDGQPRAGAQVAELTRYLRPSRNPWPAGDARHGPAGTTAPRRAAAPDRRRRLAHHPVRDQRQGRAHRRP